MGLGLGKGTVELVSHGKKETSQAKGKLIYESCASVTNLLNSILTYFSQKLNITKPREKKCTLIGIQCKMCWRCPTKKMHVNRHSM